MTIKDKLRKLKQKMNKMETRHMLEMSDLKIELQNVSYGKDLAEARLELAKDAIDNLKKSMIAEYVDEPIIEVVSGEAKLLPN